MSQIGWQGTDADGVGLAPSAFVRTWRNGARDAAWVHAAGTLDVAATARLEQALHQAELRARLVVLDLRELASIDATGVEAIARAGARARRNGVRLVLLRGSPAVEHEFVATGASDSLEIVDPESLEPVKNVLAQSSPGRLV